MHAMDKIKILEEIKKQSNAKIEIWRRRWSRCLGI